MPTRNSMRRPGDRPGIALDNAVLDLDRAADRVHDAAKLDNRSIAGALDDAAVMSGDRRVDEIAAQPSEARKGPILVGTGEPAITDDIRNQDRRELSGLAHCAPPAVRQISTNAGPGLPVLTQPAACALPAVPPNSPGKVSQRVEIFQFGKPSLNTAPPRGTADSLRRTASICFLRLCDRAEWRLAIPNRPQDIHQRKRGRSWRHAVEPVFASDHHWPLMQNIAVEFAK